MQNILNELHESLEYFSQILSRKYKVDKAELYQEGFIGITEAMTKFDATKSKLITFASPYIKYKMLKFCNSERRMKYVPNEDLDTSLVEDIIIEDVIENLNISENSKEMLRAYYVDEVPIKELAFKYKLSDGATRKIIKSALLKYQKTCKQ